MNKIIKNTLIVLGLMLLSTSNALASEVTGNLSTGIGGNAGSGLQGTVIIPSPSPSPSAQNNAPKQNQEQNQNQQNQSFGMTNFVSLMANWGKPGKADADLNKDGVVDIKDFVVLMSNWKK